ncbi:polysaccharide biosynthesis protein [Herpetosiphon geysericola]|nr:hypothetical protein [Herpetosiphon geysericola]
MAMRIIGTGLGFFFWLAATRLAVPDAVGHASVLISAAMFMANIAQMGLGYVVLRQLRHHPNPSALINLILVLIAGLTVVLVSIAVGTMTVWFPQEPTNRVLVGGILLLLTMSLALAQIVNWIFLAQQRLRFSLYKQVGQASLALVLILLLRPLGGFVAIMLAYTLAVIVVTLVSIGMGLPKVIPHYQRTLVWAQWPHHTFRKDALPNYLADQLQRLPDMLLPLIVVHQAGAQLGAVFFIMWSLGSSISSWTSSTADAFLREGIYHPEQLVTLLPRVLMTGVGLTVGFGSLFALVSPILLPWYGQTYAALGQPFLLLLLIGNIPWVGTTLLITLLRIQQRPMAVLLGLLLSNGLGVVGISLLLPYGLTVTGWGWILVQSIVGLALGCFVWFTIRYRRHHVLPNLAHETHPDG